MLNTLIFNPCRNRIKHFYNTFLKMFLPITFVLVFVSVARSQVQTSWILGDTVYRYSTGLDMATQRFSDIRLSQMDFPCVDELLVRPSSLAEVDFELTKKAYREFYDQDATVVKYKGLQGPDLYLGKSGTLLVFKNALPMARSARKDDFYEQTENDIFLLYTKDELPKELSDWLSSKAASSIRISVLLRSKHSYKNKDSFDNLSKNMEGFVIKNELDYLLTTLEIKKETWEEVDRSSNEILQKYFGDIHHEFLSFYSYESLAEQARITLEPENSFYFHSSTRLGTHLECNYSGAGLYVFPNPTFGELKVKFVNSSLGDYDFIVSNIIGKVLWQSSIRLDRSNQEVYLELPALSKGVYLYKIKDPTGRIVQSRRLILVEP